MSTAPAGRADFSRGSHGSCGFCGYDLSSVPTERCPECGRDPSMWQLRRDPVLRRLRAIHVTAACIPLVYLLSINVAYIAAWVSLGEWPGPWNHRATMALWVLWRLFAPAAAASLVAPGVVWIAISSWVMRKPAGAGEVRQVLLRLAFVCTGCWAAAFLLALFDPVGAFNWMLD